MVAPIDSRGVSLHKPFSMQQSSGAEAQITSADVQAEHKAALLSLSPQQRRAIHRLQQAKQRSHFNGLYPEENLQAIFEDEAKNRSVAE